MSSRINSKNGRELVLSVKVTKSAHCKRPYNPTVHLDRLTTAARRRPSEGHQGRLAQRRRGLNLQRDEQRLDVHSQRLLRERIWIRSRTGLSPRLRRS